MAVHDAQGFHEVKEAGVDCLELHFGFRRLTAKLIGNDAGRAPPANMLDEVSKRLARVMRL